MDDTLQTYEAARSITIRGVSYKVGDTVDVSALNEHKIGQLLNHRILRPGMVGAKLET